MDELEQFAAAHPKDPPAKDQWEAWKRSMLRQQARQQEEKTEQEADRLRIEMEQAEAAKKKALRAEQRLAVTKT